MEFKVYIYPKIQNTLLGGELNLGQTTEFTWGEYKRKQHKRRKAFTTQVSKKREKLNCKKLSSGVWKEK